MIYVEQKTTDAVLNMLENVLVEYMPALIEIFFGSLQEKTIQKARIKDYKVAEYAMDQEGIFVDAEPLVSVDERVNKFIQKLLKADDSFILAIGYEWINNYLVNTLLKEGCAFHRQENASCHYFKLDNNTKVLDCRLDC